MSDNHFPVRLHRTGDPPPEENVAFLIGKNGAFVKRTTPVFDATVPVREVPGLGPVKTSGTYLLPPIDAEYSLQMLRFCKAAWEKYRSEAHLLISWHPRRRAFRLDAPVQTVTGGQVIYKMPRRAAEGFVFVGTMHSHGWMPAFHSATDTHTEEQFDGIHVVFGRIDQPLIEIIATLAVNGTRFPQKVENVLAGVTLVKTEAVTPVRRTPVASGPMPSSNIAIRVRTAFTHLTQKAWDVAARVNISHTPSRPPPKPPGARPFNRSYDALFDEHGRWIHGDVEPFFHSVTEGYAFSLPEGVPPEFAEPPASWFENIHPEPPKVDSPSTARTERPFSRPRPLDKTRNIEVQTGQESPPTSPHRYGWDDEENEK